MEKLKIGKVLGTHALKGELKIRSYSDFNDQRFVIGNKLYLNNIEDPFIIKTVRIHKGNYLVSFEGLQDINLVEKYQVIGTVESIYFNGAQDILNVKTTKKTIAIPYVDAFIVDEDIENKVIEVQLIKGMYDED